EYSWYLAKWMAFPSTGLTRVGGQPVIDNIACFDNNSVNPSGIYVISDTAVFVYNYYMAEWLPLHNTGLIRISGKVQISSLTAYKETDTGTNRIIVVSDTAVFRYDWYMQAWYPLSNDGLSPVKTSDASINPIDPEIFPNPTGEAPVLRFTVPESCMENIHVVIYDRQMKAVKDMMISNPGSGRTEITIDTQELNSGVYFTELVVCNYTQARRVIIIK
ncbi:MAG: T9SS type A sorting domain-containing protein, partial [Bacteroidota bacterium]